MKWNDLKLNTKFFIAFGIIITLLLATGLWAIYGIFGIVGNASEALNGNKFRSNLESKYLAHMEWAKELNSLLTDDKVTELTVQTDHYKCEFGKWYYGKGRQEAELQTPQLKPLFKKFEEPHMHLHASAIKVAKAHKQIDWHVSLSLMQAKQDHINWVNNVKDAIFIKNSAYINVTKDPSKCNFSQWLISDDIQTLIQHNPELENVIARLSDKHDKLHNSVYVAESYQKKGENSKAKTYFNETIKHHTNDVLAELNNLVDWSQHQLKGMDHAKYLYQNETTAYLDTIGQLFKQTIKASNDFILTDEVMLKKAKTTQLVVILFIVIALIIAIALAYFITQNLLKPIHKSVAFANQVAEGDLTATIDIDQKDEIGQLASALSNMVSKLQDIVTHIKSGSDNLAAASQQLTTGAQQISTGVNEQAASAEEISSSMEEMTANIHQNSANANDTLKISEQSSESIQKVAKASEESVQSATHINKKIKVIVEIAGETNILALNAAVQAARAGEHGKGFTVVANAVRKLAERSKVAAFEIVEIAERGSEISKESHELLKSIIPQINETTKLVEEISMASKEQEQGVNQVNSAIQQFSTVTQQNASSAEEMAGGSEELASQASELEEMTRFFTVQGNGQKPTETKEETTNSAPPPDKHPDHSQKENPQQENFKIDLDLEEEYISM